MWLFENWTIEIMRREKTRAENEERYFAKREKLREKRQRKNSSSLNDGSAAVLVGPANEIWSEPQMDAAAVNFQGK